MKTTDKYVFFWNGIYSNWHPSHIVYEDIHFANSEQMFMYFKALHFKDLESIDKIIVTTDPRKVKKLGREIKNFNEQEWAAHRLYYMFISCFNKFNQSPELAKELLATGNKTIVEASPLDKIWGIGMDTNHPDIEDESKWQGLNLLGKVLMDVRDMLKDTNEL